MAEKTLCSFGAVDIRGENYSGPVPVQEVPPQVEDTEMVEVPPVEEVPVLPTLAPRFECASLSVP